jgi:hypothetical protein
VGRVAPAGQPPARLLLRRRPPHGPAAVSAPPAPDPLFGSVNRRAPQIAVRGAWAAAFRALRDGHLRTIANDDWVYFPTAQMAAEALALVLGQ